MIENNRCSKCKYVYEVSWDDEDDKYYCDEDGYEDLEREELYPEYCPFCGTHRAYGNEGDSFEDDE
jgi:CRISPR/Cas system-associated protein Cas10 (large subunit of type III CRISPR-Cas system)